MKISSIEQQKKYEENVNIFADNKFWISLNKSQLIDFGLHKDKDIDEDLKLEIENASVKNKILQRAYVYLQSRPRSRKEIHDHFVYKKQLDEIQVNGVLDELEKKGMINDNDFAKWFTTQRQSSGFHGPNKIKAELMKKGISASVIKELFAQMKNDDDHAEHSNVDATAEKIRSYVEKIKDKVKGKTQYEVKNKIYGRLMARGYNFDDFKAIVDELLDSPRG